MTRSQLIAQIFEKKSFLCVGLDTERSKLPAHLQNEPDGVRTFNKAIIDATRDLCVAYKPNLAFYEAMGPDGMRIFKETVAHIGSEHLIIADAKRGDIGNTGRMYAEAFFNAYGCDAVTVAPYMGEDSVRPFLGFEGKWAIVLALTSNAGSADFQTAPQADSGMALFEKVIQQVATWGTPDNLMYVVGATHPRMFERVRALAPDHFLLVPGVGAQGGDLASVCQYGLNSDVGLLVNASRSIIYAGNGPDFAEMARAEAFVMQQEMALQLTTWAY
jgi:orotidine-5'-phosphate decarboxylase